ncbi:MAG: hypothetical protein RIC03_06885 [Cyclobacteriaceae bacterium]
MKVFKVADIHRLFKQVSKEKITFGRMVEIMNEMAETAYKETQPDPTICACGHKHPLVAKFGSCGDCMEKALLKPI